MASQNLSVLKRYQNQPLVDSDRFYPTGQTVDFDEDRTHEFKGHRNLSYEELPNFVKFDKSGRPTRQPLSKAVCSFLNSLFGGVIYCGITDTGAAKGLSMLQSQREHFVLALHDLLTDRFMPSVPESRFDVKFVPLESSLSNALLKQIDPETHHEFRTDKYCSCDKYAEMVLSGQCCLPKFIAEIHINAPPEVEENDRLAQRTIKKLADGTLEKWPLYKHPTIYTDQVGECFFRSHAMDRLISERTLVQIQFERSANFYQPIIDFYQTLTSDQKRLLPVNKAQE